MPSQKPRDSHDLMRISQATGVSAKQIVSAAENQDLFAGRDPAVLFKEDEIWIPPPEPKKLRVRVGTTVYLVYRPPTRLLHLELRDETGTPRQVDYTLRDFEHDGTETGKPPTEIYGFAYQGIVHEELPASVTKVSLVLEDDPEQPIVLELGRLDPVSTIRGLKARLHNLGLYAGELNDTFDSATASSLRMFQHTHDLPATGQADPQTRKKLVELHGS